MWRNIKDLFDTERLQFGQADISDYGTFDMLKSVNYDPDVIYNLACPASPKHYQKDPVQTILTTTQGVYNSLNYAKYTGAKYFFSSTSEVYGDPLEHPQKESYHGNVNTWGPRACYDEGKRLAETLCYEYSKLVDIRIVRIFNTYGPYMAADDGRVVSNFIIQTLRGQPITIYGTGKQSRSFCYIDDLLQGFMKVGASQIRDPVNLGNPNEFTLIELAEAVCKVLGMEPSFTYHDLPKDDPKNRQPDITVAASLGWEPKIQLLEGIKKTAAYFEKQEYILNCI